MMTSKLKKFFKSKKNEAKFKLGMAGPGHRLGDSSSPASSSQSSRSNAPRPAAHRMEPSAEAQQAAAAALARLELRPSDKPAAFTSLAAIKAQAKRELEAEMAAAAQNAAQSESEPAKPPVLVQDPAQLASSGIFFICPLIGPEVLPKEQWHAKIREFLYEQLEHERALTAVLMIHTLNKNKEKVEQCVKTIHRMFENITNHPGEEKYRRVKLESRAFQDKIKEMEGGLELLLAAGFEEKEEETSPGVIEKFLVFPEEKLSDVEQQLPVLCDALETAEPITLELDRGLQVLLPSQASRRQQLPPDFFRITPEEIKREHQLRSEAVERGMMLRTKAMREKEELREMKMYKYAIIRIRFPDGVLLQGTFSVYEKLEAVLNFVKDSVVSGDEEEARSFSLTSPTGQRFAEGQPETESSLIELRLVPATILTFSWKSPLVRSAEDTYLKPELMVLMQSLD